MRAGIWILLAGCCACAQDIPDEAQRVLDLARAKVLHTTRSLPRYTCQETIEREYFEPSKITSRNKETCDGPRRVDLIRAATDRIRLEVAISESHEINAWPGASQFDSRGADELVTTGPISTGAFGTLLMGVFANPGAHVTFAGEKIADGKRIFRYRYSVPVKASHYQVKMTGGIWWNTAYSGEFEISADSADLAHLTEDTGTLSADSGMCRAETAIDYHYEKVGDGGFLIPQQARLRTSRMDGSSTMSVTTFSACHEYTAESTIRFDDVDSPSEEKAASAAKAAEKASAAFAGGLQIALKLAAPIDTDAAAAGDIVWATIAKPVLNPRTKQVVAPAGVRVRGRIVTARHYLSDQRGFDIGIEFDRYEMKGVTAPFAAILLVGDTHIAGAAVSLRPLQWGGMLSFHTKSARLVAPAGTDTLWMTLTPPKAK